MKVVGFSFNKIAAEKSEKFSKGKINSNIEVLDVGREKVGIQMEGETLRFLFKHTLSYEGADDSEEKMGEVAFEGSIIVLTEKDETKEIFKNWKKRTLPNGIRVPLFNLILRRCTTKALQLQEELNLPTHVPIPKITLNK